MCEDLGYCCSGYQQAPAFGKSFTSRISSLHGNKVRLQPLCLILDDSHFHPVGLLKPECNWPGKHQRQSDSNLKGDFLPGEGKSGDGNKIGYFALTTQACAPRAEGNPAAGTALSWYGIKISPFQKQGMIPASIPAPAQPQQRGSPRGALSRSSR